MQWSLGIGTTYACNLRCAHCYAKSSTRNYLTVQDVADALRKLDVYSVNFGTGENGLNPHFSDIVRFCHERGIITSLTSNGYTVLRQTAEELQLYNDVDVSVDFPRAADHDAVRGEGSYDTAISAVRKCTELGIEVSIVSCMMNINYDRMEGMLELAAREGVNLRINVYKPVFTDIFTLTYDQFWSGIRELLANGKVLSCSEAVVNTVIGSENGKPGCPCGKGSARIRPDGQVIPCVYWNSSDMTIEDLKRHGEEALLRSEHFAKIREIPDACRECEFVETCEGGCASRRLYTRWNKPDPYCYIYNKCEKPELTWQFADDRKCLVHSDYLCTIIMEPS